MECRIVARISAPATLRVESVGRWFEEIRRGEIHSGVNSEKKKREKLEDGGESEPENDPLYYLTLDPKEWKSQDHYAVLGLEKVRFNAADDDIKKAYKKKVLKHHPDKKGASAERQEDDIFTCIKRAYEVLGDPVRRRAYDSIDSHNDDTIPSVNSQSKETFFEVFTSVFQNNARWSRAQPVPSLGTHTSTVDEVNAFYSFWYAFDSWREFSYLDEEDTEKAESRDERRWMEKQNKIVRQERRREEVARIRQLVDNSYACDPRIKRFKEEEKQRKLAEKKAKQDAARAVAEQKEKAAQEAEAAEQKLREEAERKAREETAAAKKERESKKKELRKERKNFRTVCQKQNNFSENESEIPQRAEQIEVLCQVLSIDRLQALRLQIEKGSSDEAKKAFLHEMDKVKEEERLQRESASKREPQQTAKQPHSKTRWNEEELKLLVKAVQRYPAGTINRWEQIASFITAHVPSSTKTPEEIISQVKRQQSLDDSLKLEANRTAFSKFDQEHISRVSSAAVSQEPTQRYDGRWSAEEQRWLEEALRTVPTSAADRWDRIASHVGRSKKECMKRCKELVKMVQAKKGEKSS
ncbi:dnaJ homolog subfamily C member 2-like isoform X2 [Corticium candelabrum]|uniref:dnaJ homolog subfamily C member 2-like isoform X1 n=1 Tax=Corticium candelabrum TaxID=121492 RepID=UPI002E25AAB5|nr:dnaJ homolog subfamily C member 2-like isoform X1 [Corticium candelabrum]XP_062522628.1 dnaJ homolog subfamily C member 2-like isoform X2 [Corticium candelabrum]